MSHGRHNVSVTKEMGKSTTPKTIIPASFGKPDVSKLSEINGEAINCPSAQVAG
jgi:hypothetical protein